MKLILASNSKWRKKLINMAGFECEAIPSNVSEDIEFTSPDEYVKELSRRKAKEVAGRLSEGIVISADTIGYMDNEKSVYECAGYSIETCGSLFISSIDGNYTNIVGLPISRIYEEIKKFGYTITDFSTF